MLGTSAILFVNLTIPKKIFKTMDECNAFKHVVEKRISASYNPVDLFRRMPTLSCVPKPVKPKVVKPKVVKPTKPIKPKPKK
jgi:hypothetical protein